ncbi:MAG: hypothetical protein JEZ02_16530 [Desulfatibacillum sp.]|nr:hypothetical protein [Desulfatibacillum sp.]
MNIEYVKTNLQKSEKTKGLAFSIGVPASVDLIKNTENRLGLKFPSQVSLFYENYNGLHVEQPFLKILNLENLDLVNKGIHFATLGNEHHLHFDVSSLNAADQWDIISEDGHIVTLTFASFWTNKLFAWIDWQRPIWKPDFWKFGEGRSSDYES